LLLCLAVLVLISLPLHAGIIYVDPDGGGDVLDIPEGVMNGGVSDTVLVAAGTYEISPDTWPIALHGGSPTIMSESGAAVTIIQGDGTLSPFRVAAHTGDSRVRIIGFTIRGTPAPILNQTAVTAEMLFADNVVEDNAAGVDVRQSVGLVARNVIQRNGEYALSIYHFIGVIESNEICGNAAGIRGVCCEDPEIRQNHIHHNTGYGIKTGFTGNITYNLIEHNGMEGIRCQCSGVMERNVIRGNAVGIYAGSWAMCVHAVHRVGRDDELVGHDRSGRDCGRHLGLRGRRGDPVPRAVRSVVPITGLRRHSRRPLELGHDQGDVPMRPGRTPGRNHWRQSMKRLLPLATVMALLVCAPLSADIIHVPGDYDTIPEAVHYGTADDTVVVGTGTYTVEPGGPFGWPIDLDLDSPRIVSEDQVGKTVLEGDGTIPAFRTVGSAGPSARVHITGFTIRNVSTPLLRDTDGGTSFHFTYNNIQDCGDGLDATGAGGLIAHNIVWNNDGVGIFIYHYFGVIEFNEIAYNTWGIRGWCCEEPTIRQNWIHRNSLGGIATSFIAQIENNVIIENYGPGIALGAYNGYVTGNSIRGNAVGMKVWWAADVLVRENGIYDNEPYDIQVMHPSRDDFDATMNWWGTTDPDLIAEHIWDCNDDPTLGVCILFDPFCKNPECEPTSVEALSWGAIKAIYR
jgi:hypothetical protein